MKRIIGTTALAIVLTAPAFAANGSAQIGVQSQSHPGGMSAGVEAGGPDQLSQMTAGQIATRRVVTPAGERIGEVERVIASEAENQAYVVVEVGGFLGIGETSIAIPLSQLRLDQDANLRMTEQVAEGELADRYQYDADRYRVVEEQTTIASVTGGAASGGQAAELGGFQSMDTDQDGQISRDEAQNQQDILSKWDAIDQNGDGRIDQGEFSAFEQQMQQQGDSQQQQAPMQPPGGGMQQRGPMQPQGQRQGPGMRQGGAMQQRGGIRQRGTLASFDELDQDSDGFISQAEAQDASPLVTHWGQVDEDQDNQINRAEFSAFEQQIQQMRNGGQNAVQVPPQSREPQDQPGLGQGGQGTLQDPSE